MFFSEHIPHHPLFCELVLSNMPHDYSGNLAAMQQNFQTGWPAQTVSGPLAPVIPVFKQPEDSQAILKCPGDYNQIPYGWRPSPFMGKCGYKIQLDKFYSANSPCFPIQDLSCMGPAQKKAWGNICKTEFPCKPIALPTYPKPYQAPPQWFAGPRSGTGTRSTIELLAELVSGTILPALGVSAACFVFSSYLASKDDDDSKTDSDSDDSQAKPLIS